MKKTILLAAAACFAASASGAFAQSITGSLTAPPASSSSAPINLDSYYGFAFYGTDGNGSTNPPPVIVDGTGSLDPHFSNLMETTGTGVYSQNSSSTYLGTSDLPSASNAVALIGGNGTYTNGVANSGSFSLTTSLIASSETLYFYLEDGSANSTLTATVDGATYSLSNTALSTTPFNNGGYSTSDGLLTLAVTGGTVGDTLTFTDNFVANANSGSVSYPYVGIQAVGVDAGVAAAIPEPSTLAYMLAGVAALVGFARRKKLA